MASPKKDNFFISSPPTKDTPKLSIPVRFAEAMAEVYKDSISSDGVLRIELDRAAESHRSPSDGPGSP